jgi:hypothetical protein
VEPGALVNFIDKPAKGPVSFALGYAHGLGDVLAPAGERVEPGVDP